MFYGLQHKGCFYINIMNKFIGLCEKLMINYQLLHALSSVISEGGFDKAAKKLFITQSAVSRRIHQLELTLGEPVLIRTQPPKATAMGKRLLNHLQQVMQLEVALNINTSKNDENGQSLAVKLAANEDSLVTWLPEALAIPELDSECKFKFEIIVDDQSIALKRMKAGEVMVCICASEQAVNGGLVSPLGSLRYQVIASPEFVKRYNLTSPEQLAELHCLVYSEDDKLQHQFLHELNGTEPQHIHICPSAEGFKQSMIAGLGYGLLPVLQLGDCLEKGELVNLIPDYCIDIPLYWHYWQTESPQLKTLRQFATGVARHRLIQKDK
jgi:LysR family transcriptional regulator (chromosome initiation inhibitor)